MQYVLEIATFQFHEGPIKTLGYESVDPRLLLFQFHEGPIKTLTIHLPNFALYGFNSMKVRLKPSGGPDPAPLGSRFNSMKVRLKRDSLKEKTVLECFNSMKVRLKHFVPFNVAQKPNVSIP